MTGSALGVQIIAMAKTRPPPSWSLHGSRDDYVGVLVGALTSRQVQLYSRGNLIRRWDTVKNHGGLDEGFGLYFERDGFLSGGVIGHGFIFQKDRPGC